MPTTTFDFTGQSVIVTGGSRGIGFALSRAFADAGGRVFAVDVSAPDDVAAALDGITTIAADVSSTADVQRVVETVLTETGRIDVLVNNAGILRDKVLWKLTDDDWDAVLAVHLGGAFRFTRACVPAFRERRRGRVVNVTSYTGLHGNAGQAAYAAAKAGVIGLTKTAAKELARFGVTVNVISPNAETRMISSIPDEKRAELDAMIPMGRFADPSEIAATVLFLASDEAGYVTGTVVPVDGGISM